MVRIDFSIDIDRRPAEVFDYLTDPARVPEWQASALEARWEGEKAPGARVKEIRRFLGRRMESEVEVTEYDPPRRFALKTIKGPFPFLADHVLEPRDDGTRLTFHGEAEPGGFFRFAESVVLRTAERQLKSDFQRMKKILEGDAPE
jgi:uncharacterized protein YndB with AHSA1/START domain